MADLPRRLAAGAPAEMFASLAERLPSPTHATLTILTYHRVADPAKRRLPPGTLSATPEDFAAQMTWLARNRPVVSADDVVACAAGAGEPPRGAVLVTFDDAYEDISHHVWPVLRSQGLPAVLFVPTGYPDVEGRRFWWDRLYHALVESTEARLDIPLGPVLVGPGADIDAAYRRLRAELKALPPAAVEEIVDAVEASSGAGSPPQEVLGWSELRRLGAEGLTLAPHSVSHPILPLLEPDELDAELRCSAEVLAARTGQRVPLFAYPSGSHDDRVVAATEAAGYVAAVTTERGVNRVDARRPQQWLRLRRVNVGRRTTRAVLRAQLAPVLARSRRWCPTVG